MYFVFADNAKQNNPSREKMGPLVAAGAFLVDGDQLQDLETAIEKLCKENRFPVDDPLKSEFKWSPGTELWMRDQLVGIERERFFLAIIDRESSAGRRETPSIGAGGMGEVYEASDTKPDRGRLPH